MIGKLNERQVSNAQKAYASFNDTMLIENNILNGEILQNIWGYKSGRDINKAYGLINQNMKKHRLVDMKLFQRVIND